MNYQEFDAPGLLALAKNGDGEAFKALLAHPQAKFYPTTVSIAKIFEEGASFQPQDYKKAAEYYCLSAQTDRVANEGFKRIVESHDDLDGHYYNTLGEIYLRGCYANP